MLLYKQTEMYVVLQRKHDTFLYIYILCLIHEPELKHFLIWGRFSPFVHCMHFNVYHWLQFFCFLRIRNNSAVRIHFFSTSKRPEKVWGPSCHLYNLFLWVKRFQREAHSKFHFVSRLKLGGAIFPLPTVLPFRARRHFDSVKPAVQMLAQGLHGAYSIFVVVHSLYTGTWES